MPLIRFVRRALLLGPCVAALCALGFLPAWSYTPPAVSPDTELAVFETDHFRVIHATSLADTAPLLARHLEEAWEVLTRALDWRPDSRVEVMYVDDVDTHNGWATALPHNTITIYAAAPEPVSTIYEPGDYLRLTAYHELAHVLSMDQRRGYSGLLSSVFGKLVPVMGDPLSTVLFAFTSSPVVLAPRWFLEGTSIWAETEFSDGGRGVDSTVDMIFRMAAEDNSLLPSSRWYLSWPHWPYGRTPYIYGMRLMEEVQAEAGGENAVGRLSQAASRVFLFNVDGAFGNVAGMRSGHLARQAMQAEQDSQVKNLARLRRVPVTEAPRLTPGPMQVTRTVQAGGRIYFPAMEEADRAALHVYDPDTGELDRIDGARLSPFMTGLAASAEGRHVYYTRLNVTASTLQRYEVERLDTRTGDVDILTREGRYREIDVSPDGSRLAAVSMRAGRCLLLETPLDGGKTGMDERVLARGEPFAIFSGPRYSPDGARLAFVIADSDGHRLMLADTATGGTRILVRSDRAILSPAWAADGRSLIVSSDLSGVANLYRVDANDGTMVPLTNVLGGLYFASISQDGSSMAAAGYDAEGFYLTILPARSHLPPETNPPTIGPRWQGSPDSSRVLLQQARARTAGIQAEVAARTETPESYNSLAGARFDFWYPWLTTSADGGVAGGLGAHFSDPTGFQNLHLFGGMESRFETPVSGLAWTYRGLYPELSLYGATGLAYYPDLLVDPDNPEDRFDHAEAVYLGGAMLDIPLIRADRELTLELGYEYRHREEIDEVADDHRGRTLAQEPAEDGRGAVWSRLNWFDGTLFPASNSVEDGRLVSAAVEWAHPDLGGDLAQTRLLGQWSEYLSVPFLDNHVLKLHGAYGHGFGDDTAQGLFGLGGFGGPLDSLSPGVPEILTLRGYPANFQTGETVVRAGASYRFPILGTYRGVDGRFPFYFRQLFAELFYEGGRTWDEAEAGDDLGWINAAGVEVNYALTLFRHLRFSPGAGVAWAPELTERADYDEPVTLYLSIKGWVNF